MEGAEPLQLMRGVSEVKKWEVQPESAIAMKGACGVGGPETKAEERVVIVSLLRAASGSGFPRHQVEGAKGGLVRSRGGRRMPAMR